MAFANSGLNLQLKNFAPFTQKLNLVDKAVKSLNKSLLETESIYSNLSKRVGNTTSSFTKLTSRIRSSESTFDDLTARVERQNELFLQNNRRSGLVGDGFDVLTRRTERYSDEIRDLSTNLLDTNNRLRNLQNTSRRAGLNNLADRADSANKRLGQSPRILDQVRGKLSEIGGAAREAGIKFSSLATGGIATATKAAGGLGLASVAAIALTTNAAIETQTAFLGIAKTVDGLVEVDSSGLLELTEDGEELKDTFQDLSTTIPVTFTQLALFGQLGAQFGIETDSLDEFAETVAILGETTNIGTEEAATGLARITGLFEDEFADTGKTQGENIADLANVIVELGNTMKVNEDEILNYSVRLSGVGATVGLLQADLFAIGASFAETGVSAEAGATAVNNALLTINNAVTSNNQGFVDNTEIIEKNKARLQGLNADLVQIEQGQHNLGLTLVQQEKDFIAAGGAAEDFGRLLGDKTREAAFTTQKEIIALRDEIADLEAQQGQPLENQQLNTLLETIQKTEEGARLTATTFSELWEKDAGAAFALFVEGLQEEGDNAARVLEELGLGSSESERAFLAMATNSDALATAMGVAREEIEGGSAATDEAAKRFASTESAIQKFKNSLSVAASDIGDVFLPAIGKAALGAQPLLEIIGTRLPDVLGALGSKFSPVFEEIAGSFGTIDFTALLDNGFDRLVTVIEEFDTTPITEGFNFLVETVFPLINSGVTLLTDNWDLLTGVLGNVAVIGGVTVAITGVVTAVSALLSPIGLAIVGVTALATAWETNFLGIQETTEGFITDFGESGLSGALEGLGIPESVITAGEDFISGFMDPITESLPGLGEAFSGLSESITTLIDSPAMQWLISGATDTGTGISEFLTNNSEAIGEFVGVLVATPIDQVTALVDVISNLIGAFSEPTTENITALGESILEFATIPFDNLFSFFTGDETFSLTDKIIAANDAIGNFVETIGTLSLEGLSNILGDVDLGLPTIGGGSFALAVEIGTQVEALKTSFTNILAEVSLGIPTFPDLLAKAQEIVTGITEIFTGAFDGIDLGLPELPDFITEIDLVPEFLKPDTTEAEEIGKSQQEGVAKGIEDNVDEPKGAIERASDTLVGAWEDFWESESPSKLTERQAKDLVSGWAIGLTDTSEVLAAVDTLSQLLTTSFERFSQIVLSAVLPSMGSFKTELMSIYQNTIPSAASTTDGFTNVTLAELVSMFDLLSGETIPAYSSSLSDEMIPATENAIEVTMSFIDTLSNLAGNITNVSNLLTNEFSPALKGNSKIMDLALISATKLIEVVKELASQYATLAAAIQSANAAGSGVPSSLPPAPSAGAGAPAFAEGGSFIVPSSIPAHLKGPTGGLLVEVHANELVNVIPASERVNDMPMTGAGVNNSIQNIQDNSTRGDTFNLNIKNPVGGQNDVISNFRLMSSLARS